MLVDLIINVVNSIAYSRTMLSTVYEGWELYIPQIKFLSVRALTLISECLLFSYYSVQKAMPLDTNRIIFHNDNSISPFRIRN